MPKPIENGQKLLANIFRTPTDCRFWETTAIVTHENKERLMYSKGLLLNQIEQMRSYRTFPLVGPSPGRGHGPSMGHSRSMACRGGSDAYAGGWVFPGFRQD